MQKHGVITIIIIIIFFLTPVLNYYYYYYKSLRQLLGASWTEGKSNTWVLENIGMESHLLEVIKKETVFFWMRIGEKGCCSEKLILQGRTSGRRHQGFKEDQEHNGSTSNGLV